MKGIGFILGLVVMPRHLRIADHGLHCNAACNRPRSGG